MYLAKTIHLIFTKKANLEWICVGGGNLCSETIYFACTKFGVIE